MRYTSFGIEDNFLILDFLVNTENNEEMKQKPSVYTNRGFREEENIKCKSFVSACQTNLTVIMEETSPLEQKRKIKYK